MDDIVQRLRKWSISTHSVPASDLMDEAADEIERLRRIVAMWEDCAFKTKDLYGNVFVPRTSTYDGGVNRIVSGEWSEPKVSTGRTGNQWFTIPEPPVPYEKNDENRGDSHAIRGTKEPPGEAVTEPMLKEKRAEVSYAEPVAWAVIIPLAHGRYAVDDFFLSHSRAVEACDWRKQNTPRGAEIVPLYRNPQPTLTDSEREAIHATVHGCLTGEHISVLWGLLKRSGGNQ